MAHSAKKKAKVLAAVGVTHSVREAAAEFKVDAKTITNWQREARGIPTPRIAPIQHGGGIEDPSPQQSQPSIHHIRTATIASAVLSDIAQARAESMAELLRMRKMAIRRLEDSMLPLRRKKITAGNEEHEELDMEYAPPKVDLVGALYMLNDILGIKTANVSEPIDEEPAEVEIRIVREEEPAKRDLQIPPPANKTGT